ncbi:hypothetical protein [Paraburkholderia dinghuensis]|uniref:hypothetical protein n=1 Tax=Paraburkholderia dinghuensis TaxID=2305225 RepID=UPI001C8765C6|nr:hypothetical protein [Paraburkholderia dinghuensis]
MLAGHLTGPALARDLPIAPAAVVQVPAEAGHRVVVVLVQAEVGRRVVVVPVPVEVGRRVVVVPVEVGRVVVIAPPVLVVVDRVVAIAHPVLAVAQAVGVEEEVVVVAAEPDRPAVAVAAVDTSGGASRRAACRAP